MKACGLGIVALLLSGCGGVLSEHPASDDATSRVDERLIGFWRVDGKASTGKDGPASQEPGLLVVGRRDGPEGGLELLTVSLKQGAVLDVAREPLRATSIAGKPYASVHVTGDGSPPRPSWLVLRYDVPEEGVLRVLAMDVPKVANEVREGRIAGHAPEPGPGRSGDSVLVTLSADTAALRAWLEQAGDGLFADGKPLVLRRLDLR